MSEYYKRNYPNVLSEFNTGEHGLSEQEAKQRLRQYGYNRLKEKKKLSKLEIFIRQFKSFIVAILLAAMLISLFVGEFIDSIVIGVILVLNAVFGFIQEYKAEKAIEALKKLSSHKSKVIRDGKEQEILSEQIVPGDILVLEEGILISADARLFEAKNLETQEASLTGESLPVNKLESAIKADSVVAEQHNMAFSGTTVTRGRGRAVVVATAMKTEIGKIAEMIQAEKEELTPLQLQLRSVGKWLGIATILICLIVFLVNYLKGGNLIEVLLVAVSLAVAAIPEGLPAVVTISLALGVQRMIKRNVLIRKLPSVETLGCTTVICSDKTGTLTHNEMTVREIFFNNKVFEVTGAGYNTQGSFMHDGKEAAEKELELILRIGCLCTDAVLDTENNKVIGDPTEGALIVSCAKAGMKKEQLEKKFPRIDEIPFDSERKLMTTFHHAREGKKSTYTTAYVKGAPDVILGRCSHIFENNKVRIITPSDKKKMLHVNEEFAKQALRILGFAYKHIGNNKDDIKNFKEQQLVFVGLQAMIDPPRAEVKDSIRKCHDAGIKVVMITGDHRLTAEAIAKELGIKGKSLTGEELEKINLGEIVNDVGIYARVNPSHKMEIINALREKGHIVAMTGDGVNDAPALKKAEIGISMGVTGTDVAKEASDMVLTDDNFTSIVNAVEEGRGIYDNIRKFINYLLSSNFGEVLVIFIAGLLFNILPLVAIQILWINLITDGLPALALGVDPIDKNIMQRKPRKPKSRIIDARMGINIIVIGILICIGTLFVFHKGLPVSIEKARTLAFTTLVVLEVVRIQMIRSQYNIGIFTNKYLIGAVLISILLQLGVIYTPLNTVFKLVPLGIVDWIYILGATVMLLIIGTIASRIISYKTKNI